MWITQTGSVPAGAQSPHQRENIEPSSAVAVIVKVMTSPSTEQIDVQDIPPGSLVTRPAPVPPTAPIR
jgi:hypothetical protein